MLNSIEALVQNAKITMNDRLVVAVIAAPFMVMAVVAVPIPPMGNYRRRLCSHHRL